MTNTGEQDRSTKPKRITRWSSVKIVPLGFSWIFLSAALTMASTKGSAKHLETYFGIYSLPFLSSQAAQEK